MQAMTLKQKMWAFIKNKLPIKIPNSKCLIFFIGFFYLAMIPFFDCIYIISVLTLQNYQAIKQVSQQDQISMYGSVWWPLYSKDYFKTLLLVIGIIHGCLLIFHLLNVIGGFVCDFNIYMRVSLLDYIYYILAFSGSMTQAQYAQYGDLNKLRAAYYIVTFAVFITAYEKVYDKFEVYKNIYAQQNGQNNNLNQNNKQNQNNQNTTNNQITANNQNNQNNYQNNKHFHTQRNYCNQNNFNQNNYNNSFNQLQIHKNFQPQLSSEMHQNYYQNNIDQNQYRNNRRRNY